MCVEDPFLQIWSHIYLQFLELIHTSLQDIKLTCCINLVIHITTTCAHNNPPKQYYLHKY